MKQTAYKNVTINITPEEAQALPSKGRIVRASNGTRVFIYIRRNDKRTIILNKIKMLKKQLDGFAMSGKSFGASGNERAVVRRRRRKLCTICNKKFRGLTIHTNLKHGGVKSNLPHLTTTQ